MTPCRSSGWIMNLIGVAIGQIVTTTNHNYGVVQVEQHRNYWETSEEYVDNYKSCSRDSNLKMNCTELLSPSPATSTSH